MMFSGIYEGHVRHRRYEPTTHEFRMSLFLMYLDLDELSDVFQGRWLWSVEKLNAAAFHRRHHIGDPSQPLGQTIRELVFKKIDDRPVGPIRLLTNLSYFGYCFNPLSIFFCFDSSGEKLHSIVAEVTNTPWGERHCYVLDARHDRDDAQTAANSVPKSMKQTFQFDKTFHVSPFLSMHYEYRWQLSGPNDRLILHAENWTKGRVAFDATLSLERREITTWSLAKMLIQYPLMTHRVIASIYWQAFRLWHKRIPYVPHPKTVQIENSPRTEESVSVSPEQDASPQERKNSYE